MARKALVCGVVGIVLAAAGATWADEQGIVVNTAPGQQTRGAHLGAPELKLSLHDAVVLALQHNINLEVSRLGFASAGQGIFAATGIFDPYTKLAYSEASSDSPATNQLVGAQVNKVKHREFDLSIGSLLPTGATIGASWTNGRTQTNSTFYFLNPSYSSSLGFQVTQPLLKSFGTDVNRTGIEVARRNRDISRLQFEQIVVSTLQQVEGAYWNLVYVRDNLKVKRESLKLAQDLLDQTRTRVRIGTSAPIDIIQSEATVAAREQDIILAENAVADAGDLLKGLLGFENPEDWKSVIVPTDELELPPMSVDLDQALEQALFGRPELKQRALQRDISALNLLAADNAVRPELDLVLGYGYQGVGGTYTARDPQTGQVLYVTPGGFDDALRQIRQRDYAQWSAGLNLTYTLGNHQAKAQRAQSRYALSTAEQNLAAQRQRVIEDVRTTVRGLEAGAKSIAAAIKARELAERNLDAEQKKFANGMSTNFQVLQIQEALAVAEAAELQSRVAYRNARVAYHVAIGNLLDSWGIALKDEAGPREPHTFLKDVGFLKYANWAKSAVPAAPSQAAAKPAEGGKAKE